MADNLTQPQSEAEKEHRFIPRAFGLLVGAASGIAVANHILYKKMHKWVVERLFYGNDPKVKFVQEEILKDLEFVNEGKELTTRVNGQIVPDMGKQAHVKALSEKLKKVETKFYKKFKEKERIGQDIIDKAVADITDPRAKLYEAQKVSDKLHEAEINYEYFRNRAKGKIYNNEIIERMQLRLRNVEGRRWVFIGGAVVMGAVGYTAYKIADKFMNHAGENKHKENVVIRRKIIQSPEIN